MEFVIFGEYVVGQDDQVKGENAKASTAWMRSAQ